MEKEHLDNLLKDEYLLLQNAYEDFDRRALLIKGWSITVALGGIGLAFQSKSMSIMVLAGLAALFLWVMEALWKFFQYCSGPRISAIEEYFRGESEEIFPLQAYTSWFEVFSSSQSWYKEILSNMFLAPVLIPHAPALIVIASLMSWHYIVGQLF
ncbi:MAG: hypothetical protein L3J98_05705 [Gammaproteobacteria bacterium]|nr:hypothetical protein [Gammaproteobacteria bacterium]MCF6259643.1 hypothetical protein [Gammaproteobacteria bacterium]